MAKNHMNGSYHLVCRIDTILYKDFRINEKCFKDSHIYKLGYEMRDTCDEIHKKQYKQLRKIFIPLCLESHDIYYFNILSMITLFIICTLSMKYMPWHIPKGRNLLNDHISIKNTMSKWVGGSSWGGELGEIITF